MSHFRPHVSYTVLPLVATVADVVEINTCLRLLGVHVGDSIDRLGRERFHPLDLDYHYNGGFPDWLQSYAKHKPKNVIFVIKNSK